jgi:hypothetical protein
VGMMAPVWWKSANLNDSLYGPGESLRIGAKAVEEVGSATMRKETCQ